MKILVLCVDRDDDFGVKAGLNSPFIGREENLSAALALGLSDSEDSDTNTLLAAIGIYDEMVKSGMDAEITTICGDVKVGYESDLVLATQLENVLEMVKPDRVVLVSDGAEDEFIYPMVSSRVKIDSVRRVFVKQAPTVEGTYYILMKMLRDDKIRKRLFTPIGLVLAVFGLFSLAPKIVQLSDTMNFAVVSEMAVGSISLVLGLYLLVFAYKVVERSREFSRKAGRAVRSGSQMIPFAILSIVLIFLGIVYGIDAARADPQAPLLIQALLFVSGALWAGVFALVSYQAGRFVNHFLSRGKIYSTYLVVSVTVFAIGFIIQGALDASQFFLGYRSYKEVVIILEVVAGFLLAVFGGLLSTSMRSITPMAAESLDKTEKTESVD
jgi:putative membrane protein